MNKPGEKMDISRAIHNLEGVLKGIACDREISIAEITGLKNWLDNHSKFSHIYPFCEAYECVEKVIEDSIITEDEMQEMLDFCNTFESLNGPIDALTKEIRVLHGYLNGIILDGKINKEELKALKYYISGRGYLIDKYPFEECYNIIEKILDDGKITPDEEKEFLKFAKGFSERKSEGESPDKESFSSGLLNSSSPLLEPIDSLFDNEIEIKIQGCKFCLTGLFSEKRASLKQILSEKGAVSLSSPSGQLNYLVVGGLSNPCWMYSTYGRKIEKVIELRKAGTGNKISIIPESVFITALKTV